MSAKYWFGPGALSDPVNKELISPGGKIPANFLKAMDKKKLKNMMNDGRIGSFSPEDKAAAAVEKNARKALKKSDRKLASLTKDHEKLVKSKATLEEKYNKLILEHKQMQIENETLKEENENLQKALDRLKPQAGV